jgi:hypothetical protein
MGILEQAAIANEQPKAAPAARQPIDFSQSAPYFAALLLTAVVAFWPSYLSRGFAASSSYTHMHAAMATLWILMLITQPAVIRARRMELHRRLGRFSYGVAAAVLISVILLAHSRIKGVDGPAYARQTFVLYLQMFLGALFAISYVMALVTKRNTALHARFMVCTSLTLIDPIFIRLLNWAKPQLPFSYFWITFGLTDAIFLILIFLERKKPTGRMVFPVMLGVFALAQIPALLRLTNAPIWQAFARWFAALPLT